MDREVFVLRADWQRAPPEPRLDCYLPPSDQPAYPRLLVELIKEDMECRRQPGRPPKTPSQYIEECPDAARGCGGRGGIARCRQCSIDSGTGRGSADRTTAPVPCRSRGRPRRLARRPPPRPLQDSATVGLRRHGQRLSGRRRRAAKTGGRQSALSKPLPLRRRNCSGSWRRPDRRQARSTRQSSPSTIFGREPDGTCYIVMEYIDGQSLAERLKSRAAAASRRPPSGWPRSPMRSAMSIARIRPPRSQAAKHPAGQGGAAARGRFRPGLARQRPAADGGRPLRHASLHGPRAGPAARPNGSTAGPTSGPSARSSTKCSPASRLSSAKIPRSWPARSSVIRLGRPGSSRRAARRTGADLPEMPGQRSRPAIRNCDRHRLRPSPLAPSPCRPRGNRRRDVRRLLLILAGVFWRFSPSPFGRGAGDEGAFARGAGGSASAKTEERDTSGKDYIVLHPMQPIVVGVASSQRVGFPDTLQMVFDDNSPRFLVPEKMAATGTLNITRLFHCHENYVPMAGDSKLFEPCQVNLWVPVKEGPCAQAVPESDGKTEMSGPLHPTRPLPDGVYCLHTGILADSTQPPCFCCPFIVRGYGIPKIEKTQVEVQGSNVKLTVVVHNTGGGEFNDGLFITTVQKQEGERSAFKDRRNLRMRQSQQRVKRMLRWFGRPRHGSPASITSSDILITSTCGTPTCWPLSSQSRSSSVGKSKVSFERSDSSPTTVRVAKVAEKPHEEAAKMGSESRSPSPPSTPPRPSSNQGAWAKHLGVSGDNDQLDRHEVHSHTTGRVPDGQR